jgi:hypothetical protein
LLFGGTEDARCATHGANCGETPPRALKAVAGPVTWPGVCVSAPAALFEVAHVGIHREDGCLPDERPFLS